MKTAERVIESSNQAKNKLSYLQGARCVLLNLNIDGVLNDERHHILSESINKEIDNYLNSLSS